MAVTTLLVMGGYLYTLAPDVTLEDSGELAVASFYAGVPHPPGYPVWTLYTWLFTVLVPFSNIAWRVALSSAVAGALSCGLLALITSRGCSMILEGIDELKAIDRRVEKWLCMASGYVAGMLLGFNGFMWSQAVIVEVYTLSVLSLVGVLCFLLRWIYQPEARRYLYWAFFLFGICFTNHQTLIVAAMGIEVAILLRAPKLGRDLMLGNSIAWVIGLILKSKGMATSLDNNAILFLIYNAVGVSSIITCGFMSFKTQGLGSEWKSVMNLGLTWIAGVSFYLYMPLTSMTNPPLNWGYPRTWEGFVHALTRGQYERTNPTNFIEDPGRFMKQLWYLGEGAVDEFNFAYLLVALVPFLFYRRMQARERSWVGGLTAIYLCLSVLLVILLNTSPDRQSQELNRVFFTASHVMIAAMIGYGLTLIGALLATNYERYRIYALYGAAVAAAIALYAIASLDSLFPLARFTEGFALAHALAAIGLFALARSRFVLPALLALYAIMPVHAILSHWSDNEQRGHLFGYWFGHDMFTPPFQARDGQPLYPEMGRNAVLFGGTDPGRFNPTYMIFCESFIPPSKKPRDPEFDRRDVYLITQNALADNTYLNYIRAHYNRSAQQDPHFFQDVLRSKIDHRDGTTNLLARLFLPVDRFFTNLGDRVEKRRRAQGVYPPKEIITPTVEDSQRAFQDYITDAQRRLQLNQLKPGEDVRIVDNRVQVSGQVAVMAINGLLTRVIFDRNPEHEFYVEESFPLEWMYPYLEPFGIIMKINRQPLAELPEAALARDHEFWSQYSDRLIGNWITYETPVKEICEFAERIYRRRDFSGFTGDPKFIRDDNAQKAFSKLRGSIAGVYRWRFTNARTPQEQALYLKEADFAFRQAFAYCPFSPEAVYRYIDLLASPGVNRLDDALLVAQTCLTFDPGNQAIQNLVSQIQAIKGSGAVPTTPQAAMQMEQHLMTNLTNAQAVFNLASLFLQTGRSNQAVQLLDVLVSNPASDAATLLSVAQAFVQLGQANRLENVLLRLVQVLPTSPEAWFDLAAIQAALGKTNEAIQALGQCVILSNQRLAQEPSAKNLAAEAAKDPRFAALQSLPAFKAVVGSP